MMLSLNPGSSNPDTLGWWPVRTISPKRQYFTTLECDSSISYLTQYPSKIYSTVPGATYTTSLTSLHFENQFEAHIITHVSEYNRSNLNIGFGTEMFDFYKLQSDQLHQGVVQRKKVPSDSFTSVCLIKVNLSQQAGPYMFNAHFLFMLTLCTCFSFQTSHFLFLCPFLNMV